MTALPGLPCPRLTSSTKKGKKRIHKKYIYPYQKKFIISEFARTFYHDMCLALPRTSINFNNICAHRRMPCTHSYKQTSNYMK